MSSMNLATYQQLTADAKVLERDSRGVKVWLLPDDRIMKLFRVKRALSSARIYPYNLRFARNARNLNRRGIAAPNIRQIFYCSEISRHGVIYDLLKGESFYELLPGAADETLFRIFAGFLVGLHEKGIYFRSVHPGNVLLRPDASMGLIDIQDMRFLPWPLPQSLRARNFRHLFNSDAQSLAMREFGFDRFVDLYLEVLPRDLRYRTKLKAKIMSFDNAWVRRKN